MARFSVVVGVRPGEQAVVTGLVAARGWQVDLTGTFAVHVLVEADAPLDAFAQLEAALAAGRSASRVLRNAGAERVDGVPLPDPSGHPAGRAKGVEPAATTDETTRAAWAGDGELL